jgi:hypothetical protein
MRYSTQGSHHVQEQPANSLDNELPIVSQMNDTSILIHFQASGLSSLLTLLFTTTSSLLSAAVLKLSRGEYMFTPF